MTAACSCGATCTVRSSTGTRRHERIAADLARCFLTVHEAHTPTVTMTWERNRRRLSVLDIEVHTDRPSDPPEPVTQRQK